MYLLNIAILSLSFSVRKKRIVARLFGDDAGFRVVGLVNSAMHNTGPGYCYSFHSRVIWYLSAPLLQLHSLSTLHNTHTAQRFSHYRQVFEHIESATEKGLLLIMDYFDEISTREEVLVLLWLWRYDNCSNGKAIHGRSLWLCQSQSNKYSSSPKNCITY